MGLGNRDVINGCQSMPTSAGAAIPTKAFCSKPQMQIANRVASSRTATIRFRPRRDSVMRPSSRTPKSIARVAQQFKRAQAALLGQPDVRVLAKRLRAHVDVAQRGRA